MSNGALRTYLARVPGLVTLKAALVAASEAETEAKSTAERARATTDAARLAFFAAHALAIDRWVARCTARRESARARRAS